MSKAVCAAQTAQNYSGSEKSRCPVVYFSRPEAVCHRAAVGLSADISTASAFLIASVVYYYYTISFPRLVKNP